MGDYSKAVDLGVGALVGVHYVLNDTVDLSGRAGVIMLATDSDQVSMLQIPIWLGAQHYLGKRGQGFFLAGELAFNHYEVSVETGFVEASGDETELGLNLGAGINKGQLVAQAGLHIGALDDAGNSMLLGATVGANF